MMYYFYALVVEGFVNSLLSWPAWIPLGRLTYGAYLAHPVLLSYTEFSVRSLRYADIPYVVSLTGRNLMNINCQCKRITSRDYLL